MSEEQRVEYIVEFEGVPNSPVGLLLSSLTVGKTQGQLNLNHPDISDPHCTLMLNSEILCLIDMQSEKGVYVNRVRIPPNKMIILMEGDEIHLGRVKLKVSPKVSSQDLDKAGSDTGARVIELDVDNPGKKYFDNPIVLADNKIKVSSISSSEPIPPEEEELTHEKTLSFLDKTRTSLSKITKNLFGGDASVKEKTRMLNSETLENEKKKEKNALTSLFSPGKKTEKKSEVAKDSKTTRLAIKVPTANSKIQPAEKETGDSQLETDKKIDKKKVKQALSHEVAEVSSPLSLVRLAGFLNDVLLTALVGQLLSDHDMFSITEPVEGIIFGLLEMARGIVPDAEFVFSMLDPFVPYFALYLLLRVLGNLVFGVSIGQLLVGMKAQGETLHIRISGVVRSLLEVVTKPTVVTELPVLVGKKSLKETISKANFTVYSPMISMVMSAVIPILLFFFVFLLPFFELEMPAPVAVKYPLSQYVSELDKDKPVVESKVLSVRKELEEGRDFLAYPAFQLHKGSEKKTYFPTFHLFHLESQKKIAFAKIKDYDSKELLGYLLKNNPFAVNRFSEIKKYIEGFPFDDEKMMEQVRDAFESSFILNFETLMMHTLKHGPYYRQFFDFRRSFDATVDEPFDKVDFIKVNSQFFIRLKMKSMKLDDYFLVSLGKVNSIYRTSFDKSDDVEKLFDVFFKGYLKGVQFDAYQIDFTKPFEQGMNLYETVDAYVAKGVKVDKKQIAMISLYQFYSQAGKVALEIKNDSLKNDIVKSLEKFLAFQKDFAGASEEQLAKFSQLVQAIKVGDIGLLTTGAP